MSADVTAISVERLTRDFGAVRAQLFGVASQNITMRVASVRSAASACYSARRNRPDLGGDRST